MPNRTSADILRDIDITRQNAARSIDALGERLSPGRMVDDVVDFLRETPRGRHFMHNLRMAVQENPVPVTLLSISLGWLIASSMRGNGLRREYPVVDVEHEALEHHVHVEPSRLEGRRGSAPEAGRLVGTERSGKSAAASAAIFRAEGETPREEEQAPEPRGA